MEKDEYQKLVQKYKERVRKEFGAESVPSQGTSKEYREFKEEFYPKHYSFYEKWCNISEGILKVKADPKKAKKLAKEIKLSHLQITPNGVTSFAILMALLVIVGGSLSMFALPVLFGGEPQLFFVLLSLILGAILIPALQKIPEFMANTWRIKASSEMVQSIFYLVTYMRHTPNLERAIEFAADHLDPPLSLDFRKMLWDVETEKFATIKDAASAYLSFWKEWNSGFVEAFHLIESSLYEGSEDRRLSLLDKALEIILNDTYENMLHYAHNLKSPMTMLHMLGIILPILGLVILPLVVSFMTNKTSPFVIIFYIALLYNVGLPTSVYYLGKSILSRRPAGYGKSDISQQPAMKKFKGVPVGKNKISFTINPLFISIIVLAIGLVAGLSPLFMHAANPTFDVQSDDGKFSLLQYLCPPCKEDSTAGTCGAGCDLDSQIGPYGIGASVLSIILIAGMGLGVGLYYKLRSKNVFTIREKTKQLEDEFSSSLFQLGNRLGDGIPAEVALGKVAGTMEGTTSGEFFTVAQKNILKLGMGLEQALFDSRVGAVVTFPSKVIESSMKVLVESIKKGPRIAAQALLSMSRYIKEIHRVEERLKDLMADVISSMKSQIKFLTPAIAGIVIGITSMISTILTLLTKQVDQLGGPGVAEQEGLLSIFGIGVPTYYFQIVVGIYIIQIIYILTVLSNGIENGADKLSERFELGKNLVSSTMLYCFLAAVVMVAFNWFALQVAGSGIVG